MLIVSRTYLALIAFFFLKNFTKWLSKESEWVHSLLEFHSLATFFRCRFGHKNRAFSREQHFLFFLVTSHGKSFESKGTNLLAQSRFGVAKIVEHTMSCFIEYQHKKHKNQMIAIFALCSK